MSLKSWGNIHIHKGEIFSVDSKHHVESVVEHMPSKFITHGMGRSYGDVAINSDGAALLTKRMDRILEVDWKKGIVKAEAGVTFDDLLHLCVPQGWFLPVTPGTKFISLGGAVANDVHGKNHHKSGSFGAFIRQIGLYRSCEGFLTLSPEKNEELFKATIGGIGLTGVINWVEFQLKHIDSSNVYVENIRYNSLNEFFELSDDSHDWDYSVAWVDCFASPKKRGSGIFSRAYFANLSSEKKVHSSPSLAWPIKTPSFFLNKMSISVFNFLYKSRPIATYEGLSHYAPFFYPLDGIRSWNNLYGRQGFFQHQCLIPPHNASEGIDRLLKLIKNSGQGSFLAVLKSHGKEISPGLLSFGGPGVSLALDFPNKGRETLDLLGKLDSIVLEYNGKNYLAKDGHMSSDTFKKMYPQWQLLENLRDRNIMSDLWKRTALKGLS